MASNTPGIESNPGKENAGIKTPSPLLTNDWFSIGRVERSSRMRGKFDPEHFGIERNVVAYTSAPALRELDDLRGRLLLGMDEYGIGPCFPNPLRSPADFGRLRDFTPEEELGHVLEALRLTRRELSGRVPLIGFAGAPWTLMSYMVEGGASKSFAVVKRLLVEDPARAHALLGRLAQAVGRFLVAQVNAGAQAVQLFDSWSGALGPADFREFALPYLSQAARLAKVAGVPVIAFCPGSGWALEEIAAASGADVIGVDWQTDASEARRRLPVSQVALQGNLDPCWLYAAPPLIRERTQRMLDQFGGQGHIANLGHGILPDVPVGHAQAFIDAVREWRKR